MSTAALIKCQVAAICLVWYICSSANAIVNKMILQKYSYPITVALSNQILIPILAIPILRRWEVRKIHPTPMQFKRYLLPIAFGRAIAVGSAAFSLSLMPVSYTQTVKALMPIFAVFFGRIFLHEHHTPLVYVSLLPIVVGVLVATMTEIYFSAVGLAAALLSTSTYSLLNIILKRLLKHSSMHPIRLLVLTSKLCAMVLFPVWLFKDAYTMAVHLIDGTADSTSAPDLHLLLLLVCSSVCSFAQNVCTFSLIHILTALSYAVCNATKRITVIIASLITLRNPVTGMNMAGMMMAVFGVFCYNQAKQAEKEHEQEATSVTMGEKKSLLPITRTHTTLSDASLVALNTGDMNDMLFWTMKKSIGENGGSRLASVIEGNANINGINARHQNGTVQDDHKRTVRFS